VVSGLTAVEDAQPAISEAASVVEQRIVARTTIAPIGADEGGQSRSDRGADLAPDDLRHARRHHGGTLVMLAERPAEGRLELQADVDIEVGGRADREQCVGGHAGRIGEQIALPSVRLAPSLRLHHRPPRSPLIALDLRATLTMSRIMREQARLIMLIELSRQVNGSLNSDLLRLTLEEFAIQKTRGWVHDELRYLAEMGAVTLIEAGSLLVATLTTKGQAHVDRQLVIDGVRRPSPPEA